MNHVVDKYLGFACPLIGSKYDCPVILKSLGSSHDVFDLYLRFVWWFNKPPNVTCQVTYRNSVASNLSRTMPICRLPDGRPGASGLLEI